jgi:hypothetical protein
MSMALNVGRVRGTSGGMGQGSGTDAENALAALRVDGARGPWVFRRSIIVFPTRCCRKGWATRPMVHWWWRHTESLDAVQDRSEQIPRRRRFGQRTRHILGVPNHPGTDLHPIALGQRSRKGKRSAARRDRTPKLRRARIKGGREGPATLLREHVRSEQRTWHPTPGQVVSTRSAGSALDGPGPAFCGG